MVLIIRASGHCFRKNTRLGHPRCDPFVALLFLFHYFIAPFSHFYEPYKMLTAEIQPDRNSRYQVMSYCIIEKWIYDTGEDYLKHRAIFQENKSIASTGTIQIIRINPFRGERPTDLQRTFSIVGRKSVP